MSRSVSPGLKRPPRPGCTFTGMFKLIRNRDVHAFTGCLQARGNGRPCLVRRLREAVELITLRIRFDNPSTFRTKPRPAMEHKQDNHHCHHDALRQSGPMPWSQQDCPEGVGNQHSEREGQGTKEPCEVHSNHLGGTRAGSSVRWLQAFRDRARKGASLAGVYLTRLGLHSPHWQARPR